MSTYQDFLARRAQASTAHGFDPTVIPVGTATAAPNDYLELGTSSEALGELGYMDMLTKFFVSEQRTATHRAMAFKSGKRVHGGPHECDCGQVSA